MSFFNRLYLSTVINAFGSWLTFLAIALLTQEQHGSQYVALVFLMHTLPAIILSRSLTRLVPEERQERVYLVTQILLAANSLILVFWQSLPVIFAHLLFASALKALSNPLFNTLIGKWTPKEKQSEVFTRVGGLQTGTLALAPIIGAWLKITFSSELLFAVDAITFLVSVAILKELFRPVAHVLRPVTFHWRDLIAGISPKPKDVPPEAWRALICWFLFLVIGAILNAIEFPGFSLIKMTETQIGYALAAWGGGSLFAFFVPNFLKIVSGAIAYLIATILFLMSYTPLMVIVAFFLAGGFSTYLAGLLRARVQGSVPANDNAANVWAYANQVTQVINLVAYMSAGLLLTTFGYHTFGIVMVAVGFMLCLFVMRLSQLKSD